MPPGMNFARFYMNAKIKTTKITKNTKKKITKHRCVNFVSLWFNYAAKKVTVV